MRTIVSLGVALSIAASALAFRAASVRADDLSPRCTPEECAPAQPQPPALSPRCFIYGGC